MTTTRSTAPEFLTPPRILIPKLLRSRDAWKAKATIRKAERKALQIRVRDLLASRQHHRQRAQALADELQTLQLQLDHTRQQRDQLQARLDAVAAAPPPPKTTTRPSAGDTTPSPSSPAPSL